MESVANKPDWINNKNTANECFSKDIGIDFPRHKFAVIRKEQGQLFTAIITMLPETMGP